MVLYNSTSVMAMIHTELRQLGSVEYKCLARDHHIQRLGKMNESNSRISIIPVLLTGTTLSSEGIS